MGVLAQLQRIASCAHDWNEVVCNEHMDQSRAQGVHSLITGLFHGSLATIIVGPETEGRSLPVLKAQYEDQATDQNSPPNKSLVIDCKSEHTTVDRNPELYLLLCVCIAAYVC